MYVYLCTVRHVSLIFVSYTFVCVMPCCHCYRVVCSLLVFYSFVVIVFVVVEPQCTCNVTLRLIRITIVAVEKQ